MDSQIVIGIPGNWLSTRELVTQLPLHSNGMLLAGNLLRHPTSANIYEVDFQMHDERIGQAFYIGSYQKISGEELERIKSHKGIIYILSKKVGIEVAKEMLDIGSALLKCGGLGVKVESSGLAFAPNDWNYYTDNRQHLASLVYTFVNMIVDGISVETCGMHCFGLPEIKVVSTSDQITAAETIEGAAIGMLQIIARKQEIQDFVQSPDGRTRYILGRSKSKFDPTDLFYNPRGYIHL